MSEPVTRSFLLMLGFATIEWPVLFRHQVGKIGGEYRYIYVGFRQLEEIWTLSYSVKGFSVPLFEPVDRQKIEKLLAMFTG